MSLLDQGRETVVVFQEEEFISRDGNRMTRAGTTGVTWRAVVYPAAQSGTSARRAEQDNEGFESETSYKLRLPRDFPFVLGAQAEVEWNGVRWSVIGEPLRYNGSARTARNEYTIRRT